MPAPPPSPASSLPVSSAPLREGLERLLWGDTLADKLSPIVRPRDADPRWFEVERPDLAESPPTPGRPPGLRIGDNAPAAREPLPNDRELADPRRLGRLLHAFANHELQAIELIAWALLRFSDAPLPFRRGLLTILGEEQAHLGLYLDRMATLGVSPGEVPVNHFFWRTVADSPSPFDLVVRLGLVFEQANLDFTPHYARRLRALGDGTTAAILDRVTADEVGHVRHALHWFHQWKHPDLSDADAFRHQLRLPLSVARARGPEPSRVLRKEAGLDEAFIDAVLLDGAVAGRAPVVWYFHPGFEADRARVAAGGSGPAPEDPVSRQLAADLATLPALLAVAGDVVLAPAPSTRHQKRLHDAGLPRVSFLTALTDQRHLSGLSPWGWSARSAARLDPLRPALLRPLTPPWGGPTRGKLDLPALRARLGVPAPLCGQVVRDLDEVEQARKLALDAGFRGVVLKPAWSTAGRGQLRLGAHDGADPHHTVARALSAGPLLAEP